MNSESPKIQKNRWWKWALLPVVALLLWLSLRPAPVDIDTATAERGRLEITVDEDGETRIREPYLISAPLGGRLVRVELEPGDAISKGQVLAAIDPGEPGLLDARTEAEAAARVKAAEASHRRAGSELEIARAEEEKARRYFERDRRRLAAGDISGPMLADTETKLRIARGNLEAAESVLDMARFELEQARAVLVHSRTLEDGEALSGRQFEIVSPIDGVVLRKFQESSTMVPAAERILEIGDPSDLEIRIDVLSEDAVRIRPGNPVRLEHWGGDQSLEAHVRRIEPSAFTKVSALGVDEQRVWIYADFARRPDGEPSPANPENARGRNLLGDGYRVEASIVVWREDDVLTVPTGALFRRAADTGWALYVVESDRARLREVGIGRSNGLQTQIRSGIEPGETVILHPGDRVGEGKRVRLREP